MREAAWGPERIRPGLARIRAALDVSGHPERTFRAVHVAGTNGKGSTASFAAAILGHLVPGPVGLYTSPHLVSPVERIAAGGRRISPRALARLLGRARTVSGEVVRRTGDPLTYFEAMTWTSFAWFRSRGVRVAVLETGLGGRWDATTACVPAVCVVTRIGIDHTDWLGPTLRDIAREKAGILKPGVPAVLGPLRPAARMEILAAARDLESPVWEFGRDFGWTPAREGRIDIGLPGIDVRGARIGMRGEFQKDNAAVAAAAAWRLATQDRLSPAAFARSVRRGLAAARIPGRLCPLPGPRNRGVLVDGAHNIDAAGVLADELSRLKAGGTGRIVALWSMLGDKDIGGFVRRLAASVDLVVAYPLDHERGAPLSRLVGACRTARVPCITAPDFGEAWRAARSSAGREGTVIVCGSLFAAGDAYRHRAGGVP